MSSTLSKNLAEYIGVYQFIDLGKLFRGFVDSPFQIEVRMK